MVEKRYSKRRWIISGIILIIGVVYLSKLFSIQVLDHDYKLFAENNVIRYITQYPARGLVYDRDGNLLVYNEAAYDLYVVPNQVKNIDTLELCRLLNISKDEFAERMQEAVDYSKYKSSAIVEQISVKEYAYIQEQLYKYPGFYIVSRTLRKYPIPLAANILGFVGEVDRQDLEREPYYKQGDYIGKSGIEKSYEKTLRGRKGMKIVMVDVFNREKGKYQEGKYDTMAVPGKDIYLTLDTELQKYGEKLMQNKRGSIVAIEPTTGEILAMVSSPTYDPNLLIGRIRTKNFNKLSRDTLEPLFKRPTLAQYAPGSTFKLVNALIALQEGAITTNSEFECDGITAYPIKCSHDHYTPVTFYEAIEQSCNPYFWNVFRLMIEQNKFKTIQEGYTNWRDYLMSFNIGRKFDSDIDVQRSGNLPEFNYFDRYYGEKGWRAITIRSLAIGQGEIEFTPLQLANMVAIIANRGYFYTPHLVKWLGKKNNPPGINYKKQYTKVDSMHFEPVIEGMRRVFSGEYGSAKWYKINGMDMCGKTGTAENPHGEDHSVFVAFAPAENPRIAISVVVENSGFGSTWAAPIASLMIEKYLNDSIATPWYEEKIINANLLNVIEKE